MADFLGKVKTEKGIGKGHTENESRKEPHDGSSGVSHGFKNSVKDTDDQIKDAEHNEESVMQIRVCLFVMFGSAMIDLHLCPTIQGGFDGRKGLFSILMLLASLYDIPMG